MAALHPPDHADGCACDACCVWVHDETPAEPIRVGTALLSDRMNGYAKVRTEDGEILITVKGFGFADLQMGRAEATALLAQLQNAINSL